MSPLRSLSSSRGLVSVELALVAPVFIMLMLGTAELGRALYQYNTLYKLVRGSAQYVARVCLLNGGGQCEPDATTQSNAKNLLVYGNVTGGTTALLKGLTTTNVTITAPVSDTYVTVSATYTYAPILLAIPTFGLGGSVKQPTTMTATVTMEGL